MSNIGLWAARFLDQRQVSAWHRIESEIADRFVTQCGRQMRSRTARGLLLIDSAPESQKCRRCQ